MERQNVYEVKINRNTYDIVSADTSFYAFMGDRIYDTFDKLVAQSDEERLQEYINAGKTVTMSLRTAEGEDRLCVAAFLVQEGEPIVEIRMIPLDRVQEWARQNRYIVGKKNGILGMYGDYYFDYEVKADNVRIYAPERFEQNVLSVTLAEFEQILMERADEKNVDDVKNFIGTLRNGSDRFAFNIAGDALNLKDTAYTLVKGMSYYEEGKHIYSTGYIHLWDESSAMSTETPRAMERDYLTGVLTKAEITNLAINIVDVKKTYNITLAIIDIDYFKKVNDMYGHMMGDEVLKKVASVIEREVRDSGLVGRFGGDEFLVIFYNAYDMENMRERLRSIKNSVASCFVRKDDEDISITLSIGCAAYPKDADNYEDLFFLADSALYRAKEKGRNRYIIYDSEKHGSLEQLKNTKMSVNTLNSRGNMTPAELVCTMMDRVYTGQEYPLDKLLDDVALNLNIQRVMLYSGRPYRLAGVAGSGRLSNEVIEATRDYLTAPALLKRYDDTGVAIIDNVKRFENSSPTLYDQLTKQGILSLIHIRFKDKNGVEALLSLEYIKGLETWNRSHVPYFRLLAKLLSEYDLSEPVK